MNRSLYLAKVELSSFYDGFCECLLTIVVKTVEGKSADAIGNNPQQHLSVVGVVVVRISFGQQIYRDKYTLKG